MERITGHYDKIVLTLIMCLVILFMATFSPFAESTNAVAIVDDAIIAIILVGLAAMGITFVVSGQYTKLNDFIGSELQEFANASNTTMPNLLKGTQSGTDKLGRLIVNNKFLLLIETFGRWIIAKYNLVNNNHQIVVNGGLTYAGFTVYGGTISVKSADRNYDRYYLPEGVYAIFAQNGLNTSNDVYIYLISDLTYTTVTSEWYYNNSLTSETIRDVNFSNSGNIQGYSVSNAKTNFALFSQRNGNNFRSYNTNYTLYDSQYIANALESDNLRVVDNPNIAIDTDTILLPTDDSNYTEGDGAVIDLGADWGTTYTDVTDDVIPDAFDDGKTAEANITYDDATTIEEAVENTSEITNLPAGTIPFTPLQLPQFKLADIWHYVAQWIADTAIAAGALMVIVVQEPHPMVNLFYATVCLAIIFGLIKGLAK